MIIIHKERKIGELIYPEDYEKESIFERTYWGVVTQVLKVKKKTYWKKIKWFTCVDCANLYSELIKLKIIKGEPQA